MMGLFVNDRKAQAAASSLHQFCPIVRLIFSGNSDVNDAMVETATVYLYLQMAREVFGKPTAERIAQLLETQLKHHTPAELAAGFSRIQLHVHEFEHVAEANMSVAVANDQCERRLVGVIQSLLLEAHEPAHDQEQIKRSFMPLVEAMRSIKTHLQGIRKQNGFLMRS